MNKDNKNQTDYIIRQLSKVSSKKWEHYVVNRVYNFLNDPEIEFVCQQCIHNNRDNRKRYLADLYFPQLGVYLEVDEVHHESPENKIRDAERRLDIIEAAGLEEKRISVSGENLSIDKINKEIDGFVDFIKKKKEKFTEQKKFKKWDYEGRYTSSPHLDKGFIEIGTSAAFRTQTEALKCFGYSKGVWQRGGWPTDSETLTIKGISGNCFVWFPKILEKSENEDDWLNVLSDDGNVITQICQIKNKTDNKADGKKRIVMAHSRDNLGQKLYRFLGVFEIFDEDLNRNKKTHRFKRFKTNLDITDVKIKKA